MEDRPIPSRVRATGWIRALDPSTENGGSQPHLLDTDGGSFLVKVANNPQGARVLPNELVGGLCLAWLGVRAPAPAIVEVSQDVIDDSGGAKFANGTALASGSAFGSEYWQSDPAGIVDGAAIENAVDVAGTMAFDLWLHNYDGRQARVRRSPARGKYEYFAVDQGFVLGQPDWDADSLQRQLSDEATIAYPVEVKRSLILPFIERLRSFSEADADHIVSQIPSEWVPEGTEPGSLRAALMRHLVQRARQAADRLEERFPSGGDKQ
jgi:hypothetical protein